MPATAGRVRMPANNRVHSSAALQTHGIWQSAIGYDPYAPNKDDSKSANQMPSNSEPEGENAYASFQGLLALARITGSNADEPRGACKKCCRVGHLTYQCRNFLSVKDENQDKDPEGILVQALSGLDKVRGSVGKVNGKKELEGASESEDEDEDSDSSDSDVDSEIERIISERYGKKGSSKRNSSRKKEKSDEDESDLDSGKRRKRGRSKSKGSSSRKKEKSVEDESDSDLDSGKRRKRGRSKKRSSKKRYARNSEDEDAGRRKKRGEKRRKKDDSSEEEEAWRCRRRKSRKEKRTRRSNRSDVAGDYSRWAPSQSESDASDSNDSRVGRDKERSRKKSRKHHREDDD